MSEDERPVEYWMSLALMRFEGDLYGLMEEQGVNRSDLAQATGTSKANISQILNGDTKNPQLKTLVKLARALGSYVQVRMIRDGEEVLRVLDLDEAIQLDDAREAVAEARDALERGKTTDDLITSDPRILQGKPVVTGTRISVELILQKLAGGETPEQIHASCPQLPPRAVSAVLDFAARSLKTDVTYPAAVAAR